MSFYYNEFVVQDRHQTMLREAENHRLAALGKSDSRKWTQLLRLLNIFRQRLVSAQPTRHITSSRSIPTHSRG
jgi:hypothetical protein